jgi:hypothetical protein
MATYIKGVKDYVPQLEVFKPDYKFLSDVLTVRQDRYDTNYKTINDLYSKVVYADMSREDNMQTREQYANQLSNGLKQVSGLDLSLQQNVDVAKGLFKPFFENKSLIKDMAFTKQYKKQMSTAQGFMKAPDEATRDRYWQDGIIDLQYQMKDFKSGTSEEALSQGMPNYTWNPNLYERAFEKLKESGLEIEQTTLQGDWIIKTKNGTALTRQIVGYEREVTGETPDGKPIYGNEWKTDENGNKIPIYKNPAAEFLRETVMKDPMVINGYRVQAKNRMRAFSEDEANIQQYGSVENAKKAWADNILGTQTNKDIEKIAELDTEVKNKESAVFNWEEYKKQHKIIPGTPEEEVYLKNRIELQLAQKTKDLTVERVKNAKAPTSDVNDLLNKAYSQYMASVMGPMLSKAAVAYSQVGASQTFEANPFKKMEHQHKYDLHLKSVQHGYDMNKLHAKAKYDMALAERKAQLDAINNAPQGGGIGGPGAISPSNIGSEVTGNDPDADLLEYNEERMNVWAENIEGDKVNWISDMLVSLPGSFQGSDWYGNGEITYTDSNGNKVTQDMQTAFQELRKPENRNEFNRIYANARTKFENVTTTDSGARVYKDIPSLGIDAQTAIRLQTGYNQTYAAESMFIAANEQKNKQYNHIINKVRYDDGDIKEAIDGGAPTLLLTPREIEMTKDGIPMSQFDQNQDNPKYASFDNTSKQFLNKEQYNDVYMTMARGDQMAPGGDMLAYLNKNFSVAGAYTNAWSLDYDPDDGKKIDVFENNPLLREHYRWIPHDEYFATWPPTGTWIFKEKAANKRSNRLYDDDKHVDDKGDGGMYESVNSVLGSAGTGDGDGDLPGFSVDAFMLGQEHFGTGQMAFKQYTSTYDHAIKNQMALDQLNAIYAATTGDGFKDVQFSIGDNRNMSIEEMKDVDLDDNTLNPKLAKAIWEMAVRETHYKYGKNDDRTKRPVINTSYVEKVGGPDSDETHGGYNLTFGPDFGGKFKGFFGLSGQETNAAYESFLKNGITITVPTEYDINPYKSVNQILSATDMIIQQDNKFESSIVNGGSYSIYKNQNGQYVREMQLYGWNAEQNAIVPDPIYAEPLVIDKAELDQLVITTDAYLNEIMKSNTASQTKWKNKQTN